MQRPVARFFLMMVLLVAPVVWCTAAHAAEGEAKPPAEAKKKSGGEGEEGNTKKKDTAEDVSGSRFEGDPVYVHLSPMVLPIITEDGAEQLVTLIIDIEVKDFDVADKMHSNMPKIKDALVRALYGGLGKGTLRKGKMVDVNRIKAKATTAMNELFGSGVREVLIQSVSQRML